MSALFLASVQQDPCSYCSGPADALDHIQPRARGGENDWANLTAACKACNQSKHARSLLTFLLARSRPLTPGQRIKRLFGRNVRARRLALGLTQSDVALTTGFDLMSISRWERGASTPRGETSVELACALGVSLASLYEQTEACARSQRKERPT